MSHENTVSLLFIFTVSNSHITESVSRDIFITLRVDTVVLVSYYLIHFVSVLFGLIGLLFYWHTLQK
jgi:hypothetical protein